MNEADAASDDFIVVPAHRGVGEMEYRTAQFGQSRVVLNVRFPRNVQLDASEYATRVAGMKARARPGIVNECVFDGATMPVQIELHGIAGRAPVEATSSSPIGRVQISTARSRTIAGVNTGTRLQFVSWSNCAGVKPVPKMPANTVR